MHKSNTISNNFTLKYETIPDCLLSEANKDKKRIACAYLDKSLSYGQLNHLSDIAAGRLKSAGIIEDDKVGIIAKNSLNWLITFYAILKSGGVVVALNNSSKLFELTTQIKEADVRYLCHDDSLDAEYQDQLLGHCNNDASSLSIKLVDMEKLCADSGNDTDSFIYSASNDKQACKRTACILFTSGSISKPKAVMLSHFNIVNTSLMAVKNTGFNSQDRSCIPIPFFHSFGLVIDALTMLTIGGSIFISPSSTSEDILKTIAKYHCTLLCTVPLQILAMINNPKFKKHDTSSLRFLGLSGSPSSPTQVKKVIASFPHTHIVNAYGQTEASPYVTSTKYNDTLDHIMNSVGINKFIDIRTIDKNNHFLPIGKIGEIVIKGFNVMQGYYNLPAEQQAVDADGWLHSGDLGYLDEDGYLYIKGRIRNTIIRGGETIAAYEIENVILGYSEVELCKVIGIPDPFYGESIVACLILKKENNYQESELRTILQTNLADFKQPSHMIVLDSFPLSPNGKIDNLTLKNNIINYLKNK